MEKIAEIREVNGRFKKGCSGNPAGRMKMPEEFKEMCKASTPRALQKVIDIMESEDSKPGEVLDACRIIFERAFGKPKQEIEQNISTDEVFRAEIMALSDTEIFNRISSFVKDNPQLLEKIRVNPE